MTTVPAGAGQQVGGDATRWFGWGWISVGLIDFGQYPDLFLGAGTGFPILVDLQGIHKDVFSYHILPGYVITWRALG
jgi:hypothetical protein